MEPVIPFRWDLSARNHLGSLVGEVPAGAFSELCVPLLPCASRVLAFAGDADLVFLGRSPESLFDLLSGMLFETSWLPRLTLLHFSMHWTNPAELKAEHPRSIPALRQYLASLGLDAARIGSRSRPVALIDWAESGKTFGNFIALLHAWTLEGGHDWNGVRRRLHIVGITRRTHNSPNTFRWHQRVDWIGLLPIGAVKNVSMDARWWHYFAQYQDKVSPSHTPDRWALNEIARPGRDEKQLEALRVAHALFEIGKQRSTREKLAKEMVREPAMNESWFRSLVREVRH